VVTTEAIIMEQLTSSPRTTNIYGYCGDSMIVEKGNEIEAKILPHMPEQIEQGHMRQSELDKLQTHDVHPMNNLTNEDKLDFAIEMAEGLAEQHGFIKGVMVNDDVSLKQWLMADDGRVILNDFGNTDFLKWDEKGKNYCKTWVHYEAGDFKSPEAFRGDYIDETSDIWSMGNIIFTLLTGLNPFYHVITRDQVRKAVQSHPPQIDPRYKKRSLIERRMVDIMNRCYKIKPEDRITIFKVVKLLHETKSLHQQQKQHDLRGTKSIRHQQR
jgi:serine/threonine protein kinase